MLIAAREAVAKTFKFSKNSFLDNKHLKNQVTENHQMGARSLIKEKWVMFRKRNQDYQFESEMLQWPDFFPAQFFIDPNWSWIEFFPVNVIIWKAVAAVFGSTKQRLWKWCFLLPPRKKLFGEQLFGGGAIFSGGAPRSRKSFKILSSRWTFGQQAGWQIRFAWLATT